MPQGPGYGGQNRSSSASHGASAPKASIRGQGGVVKAEKGTASQASLLEARQGQLEVKKQQSLAKTHSDEQRPDALVPAKKKKEQDGVLLSAHELKEVTKQVTNSGKKNFGGLYLPSGKKIEVDKDDTKLGDVEVKTLTQEAKAARDLTRIAKAKQTRDQRIQKRAKKEGKGEEEWQDEQVNAKARAYLEKSTEHERMEYNELFRHFDLDKDRTWGSVEIAQCFTDMGFPTSVEQAANLLYFSGVRDVDRVTYNDFVNLMPKIKAYRVVLERDALHAFQHKDRDGDGILHRNELRDVLWTIAGPGGTDHEQVEEIVRKADREKTGRISYDFFIRAFVGTPPVLKYTPLQRHRSLIVRLLGPFGRCCDKAVYDHPAISDSDSD